VQRTDVVVVGGGPAGIATALFLAHAAPSLTGRIVVLEKDRYPREKFCAGGVGARADKLLGTIGVVVDVPSVPLNGVALRGQGGRVVVRDGDIGRVVRRIEFDHALAQSAMARGIAVLDGASVSAVRVGDRSVDVDSTRGEFRARVVVGADGVASIVRRSLGFAKTRYRAQALEVDTEPVESDFARDLMLFDVSNRELTGYYWDFPTIVDGRALVCRGVYSLNFAPASPRVEIQNVLAAELQQRGLDLGRCKKKRFAERGFEWHAPASRARALLVGEAAGIDPLTGEGIAQAIQYGATAGGYLAAKLAANELEFTDWSKAVRSSKVGRDLIARTALTSLFYGAPRPAIERYVLDTPEFVRLGLQHFGGKPWSRAALVRAGWRALGSTAAWLAGGRTSGRRAACFQEPRAV
jgi:flavin-dependent dehydrogenase